MGAMPHHPHAALAHGHTLAGRLSIGRIEKTNSKPLLVTMPSYSPKTSPNQALQIRVRWSDALACTMVPV